MQVIPQEDDREAWLEWRKTKVTASMIPTIVGVGKFKKTPYTMWQQQMGFVFEDGDNWAMEEGRRLEPVVRELVNERLKANFTKRVVQHDEIEWAAASLDGIDLDLDQVLEIKCPGLEDHITAEKGQVPKHYYPQVQWQLFCSGLDSAIYASYYKDKKTKKESLELFEVQIDEDYIAEILPKAAEYYECVRDCIPPALGEDDYVQIDDPKFEEDSRNWQSANEMRKMYKDKEDFYRERLISYTDGSNAQGYGVKLTRANRDGAVDIKRLYNDLLEKYGDDAKQFDPENYRKEQVGFWRVSKTK